MRLAAEFPMVGRAAELDQIVTGLRRPAPAAFVLAGAAGLGKTRLASEAARAAADLGFATAQVVASRAAASIPFGPFAPLLPVAERAAGDLFGLLRQARGSIADRAGPQHRLLLVVDDAHLLDDGSAALLHQLVQTATCSVVANVRTPEPAPGPVTALWKDGLADRIDLDLLDERETGEVIAAVLGGPVAERSVKRFWEVSGGNALFLRELLIGAVDSGALADAGGMWALGRPLTAPGRLVELVASRLRGMKPGTIGVIELLAAGEPLGLSVLEGLTEGAELEEAEAEGLVSVRMDLRRAQAWLAHPIYGEVLRQSVPRSRLRRISVVLAGALQATGARRREDLLRLARWELDGGGPADTALLGRAARRANEMFDFELSGRLAQTALDSGGGVDTGVVLAEARFRSGRHQEAEAVLASLVARCHTDAERAMVANARAYNFTNLMGDPGSAAAVLNEALAAITDPKARRRLLGRLAKDSVLQTEPGVALGAAQELLASGDDLAVSDGSWVTSIALALQGHGDEAVAMAQRGLEAHRRVQGATQLPEAQLTGSILGHLANGHLASAEADAIAGYQTFLAAGDKEGQATFAMLRGYTLVERGQLAAASRIFLEGVSINREIQDTAAMRWCTAGRALAEGMAGNAAAAAAGAAELDALPATWMTFFEPDLVGRGRAWALVAAREMSRARDALREAAERAAATKYSVSEARLLHDIARLGDAASVAPRLAALAGTLDNEFVLLLAHHAAALTNGSPAGLETAARAFESFGASLVSAEAWLAASAAHRSAGSARLASAAVRRAADLVASCGDVRTPALARDEQTDQLTRREFEIAGLAAAGRSSREIAAHLYLSVRTVDNHLQSIYSKLGVAGREELARALGLPE